MKDVALNLEKLDNTLDTVEELVRGLGLLPKDEKRLTDLIYDFWMDVEESVELAPTDFPN